MTERPKPMNRAAAAAPAYPEPAYGNPVSSLMESGVGNCFPGLEFDIRQLDARFFPGLVFEFPGVTPAGPDGTQGARLAFVDTAGDPMLGWDAPWVAELGAAYAGDAGAALGSGEWWLHWVEQGGKRIELYAFGIYENAVTRTPYEGDTCWWIIRLIAPDHDRDAADLTIALTQRVDGAPSGPPVILRGKRRIYLDAAGVIDPVYHPGELTASMCSPWTHDFTDCACQYWASNHPDVTLGPVIGPAAEDGASLDDVAQPVTFVDWLRRRDAPGAGTAAPTTTEAAQRGRYDHYEINLRWEELSFVLQGEETDRTPPPPMAGLHRGYRDIGEVIEDLTGDLAPLELTLALEYLYAFFSIRAPEEVAPDEAARWPTLADDLRAARQLILSVALSEMTHLRWVNQTLWTLDRAGRYPPGRGYAPVIRLADTVAAPPGAGDGSGRRRRALRPANRETLEEFRYVERPTGGLDSEYAAMVSFLRDRSDDYPAGLFEIAVRIDSDGLQHYRRFCEILDILGFYAAEPPIWLRPLRLATPDEAAAALGHMRRMADALAEGYRAERDGDMARARASLLASREAMRALRDEAEAMARDRGLGVPFFAAFEHGA